MSAPFDRPDLFVKCWTNARCYIYTLQPELTKAQRDEAVNLVAEDHPPVACGMTIRGDEITTWSAD